ncbi:hypothetical protein HMPREF0322_01485, partial [Desulfitobacterium hafniense DP7]
CIIRMSSWTAGLLRVGANSPARAWKCANTFRSRRLFNFHLFLIIACLKENARKYPYWLSYGNTEHLVIWSRKPQTIPDLLAPKQNGTLGFLS